MLPLLFNCRRPLNIMIYKLLHLRKSWRHITSNLVKGMTHLKTVQPQYNSNGDPLCRLLMTRNMSILHINHQKLCYLSNDFKLWYRSPIKSIMEDLHKVSLYTPSHNKNAMTIWESLLISAPKIVTISWKMESKATCTHFVKTCNNAGTNGEFLVT